MMRWTLALALALCCADPGRAAPAASVAPALARVGVAAVVRGKVEAISAAPGAIGRIMESGRPLYANDRITTGPEGRLQILLLDETVFTIGPNTSIVLDEFVYDPKTDAGKVTASVTKGVFRFFTGKVAHKNPENMKVRLPVGTIGIRGTMVTGKTGPDKTTVVLDGPGPQNNADAKNGAFVIEQGGRIVAEVRRPGYAIDFDLLSVGKPYKLPAVQMAALLRDVEPGAGPRSRTLADAGKAEDLADQPKALAKSRAQQARSMQEFDFPFASQDQVVAQDATAPGSGITPSGTTVGISNWEDLIANPQIGFVIYSNSGGGFYNCSGGPCSAGANGTLAMSLVVDYANRTYGGYGSGSTLNFASGPLQGASTSIAGPASAPISFASLSGPAIITLTAPQNSADARFNNTTITFNNTSRVGDNIFVNLKYSDVTNGASATGGISATRPTGP